MNNRVLKILEYNKIIARLEGFATSEPGKVECRNLLPHINLGLIQKNQEETKAAFDRIIKYGSLYFAGNHDIKSSLKSLGIGASLSIIELLRIQSVLECTNRAKT